MAASDEILTASISATYQQYGGRAAQAPEVAAWLNAIRGGGATLDTVRTAVAGDAMGASYLPGVISATYQQYGGRAAQAPEIAAWLNAIRGGGATLDTVRTAVAGDAMGASYLPGVISATYQQYGGRAAQAPEVAAWLNAIRGGGATLDTVRTAVAGDAMGASYLPGVISATYQQYGGRAAQAPEIAAWLNAIRGGGATLDTVRTAVAGDAMGASYLPGVISATYQQYGGRAAQAPEIAAWLNAIRGGGATLDTVRTAVAGDAMGASYLPGVISATYQQYGGRAAQAPEVAAWLNAIRGGGATLDTVRTAVAGDAMGASYLPGVISATYQQYGGRAAQAPEIAAWLNAIRGGGATLDTVRTAVAGDAMGASYLPGVISATYQQYGGRAAQAPEVAAWLNAIRGGGATLDTVRTAVAGDAMGASYLPGVISATYQQYGGRAAQAPEIAAWLNAIRGGGATLDTVRTAVAGDAMGASYLPGVISATYQQYGGRAAQAPEIAAWLNAIRGGGATLDTVRTAVAGDAMGASYLPGVISATYQQYGGRAAQAPEVAAWLNAIRGGGATLDTVRTAVAGDAMGASYLPGVISATYQQYGGRAAQAPEIAAWLNAIRGGGATLDTVRTAVAGDAMGASYLPGVISATYQQYGGRAAQAPEVAAWLNAIRGGGATLDTVRTAVAGDAMGASYLPGVISATYQQYGGRAAQAPEVAAWLNAIRGGGATLDTVRTAVAGDAMGASYLPGVISATYQQYGGRAAQAPEIAAWLNAIRGGGATLDTVRTAIVDDTLGQSYLQVGINERYQGFGGRAPTTAEVNAWMGLIHDGHADLASLKLAILSDPLGAGYASAQLTAYFAAANMTAPSNAEVQSLLALLRAGTNYADAKTTLAQAHVGTIDANPYATATYEAYGSYFGRAPTAAEVDQWSHTLTSASTAVAQLRAALLPSAEGQAHLVAQITSEYQQYGDRSPTTSELAAWQNAIQTGGSTLDAIRIAILSSALGQSHVSDAIAAEYQEYLGRSATTGELQASLATVIANQDFSAAHQALFTTSESITYFYDMLHTLYFNLSGRDYTSTDLTQWFNQIFFGNANYATVRASLMLDPASLGANIVGTSAPDIITIHGPVGETTISNFNASVDTIRLDTASYGGTNLLDATHAREVISTDGITPNVLITIDANDHILLHGVNLAELSAGNFLFG